MHNGMQFVDLPQISIKIYSLDLCSGYISVQHRYLSYLEEEEGEKVRSYELFIDGGNKSTN